MSNGDRRATYWLGAEKRIEAAVQQRPTSDFAAPQEYWMNLAEAYVLAALAAAPVDVAMAVLMVEEYQENHKSEQANDRDRMLEKLFEKAKK